ncbi:hypothetical protein F5Y10DRAFT_29878 [Nemania abortiva]|nr:hypothetical protein F5Y10DRAFT_29878 [Nemania abortiva]
MGQKQTNFAEPEPFIALAVISTLLLFGVLIADGAFLAVVKNVVYGTFSDVTPRYTTYIGNVVIDTLLAQCVSFWTPVLTKMPAALLLSTSLCASLQTLAVWAIIEGLRKSEKYPLLQLAPLTIFV